MPTLHDDSMLFPQKLMEILADPTNHNAISWLPNGKAFVIHDRDVLAESVMPKYFSRQAKYSSFTRKLNRWNFLRVSKGPESGAYYHHFFLRDKPHLAAQMFCKNARTILAMATSNMKSANDDVAAQAEVPSFYSSSITAQDYCDTALNLSNSASLSRLHHKIDLINPSHLNMFSAIEPSNRLLLNHPMVSSQYQDQESTNRRLVQELMLQIENDRQANALSLQQQQSVATAAVALEADYLRRMHVQRMVEVSMQELQKQNQAQFLLGHTPQLQPQPKSNGNSPPSGTKRASAA